MKHFLFFLFSIAFIACQSTNQPTTSISKQAEITSQKKEPNTIPIAQTDTIKPQSNTTVTTLSKKVTKKLAEILTPENSSIQTFEFDNTLEQTITLKKGTVITFPPNCFIDSEGNKIQGNVLLKAQEFYTIGEILLANLTTQTKNELLESAGMVKLSVFQSSSKIQLTPNQAIQLKFPVKEKKKDMQAFTGTWNDNRIIWEQEETISNSRSVQDSTLNETCIISYELSPLFGKIEANATSSVKEQKSQENLLEYINNNLMYSSTALENKIEGVVYVRFFIESSGSIDDISIMRGIHQDLDRAAIKLVQEMPNWSWTVLPEQQNLINGMYYSLPIRFQINQNNISSFKSKANKFDQIKDQIPLRYLKDITPKYDLQKQRIARTTSSKTGIVYESIYSTKLGWINCDRFINHKGRKVDYKVSLMTASPHTKMFLVYSNQKSIMEGTFDKTKKQFHFGHLPISKKIKLIAIKKEDDLLFMAQVQSKIQISDKPLFKFMNVTEEELKTALNKL